jgi:small subunit ribosomal protein S15
MSRIHSKHSGRAGSVPPLRESAPDWQPLKGKDVEQQVVTLAKEGKSMPAIGLYLRDQFGVPDVRLATGKSISKILGDNDLQPKLPEDITNLLTRVVNMQEHLPKHRKDLHNRRSLELLEAKIRRLAKYYRREGRLPEDWTYSAQTARLLLE